jgi:hypothetical protein
VRTRTEGEEQVPFPELKPHDLSTHLPRLRPGPFCALCGTVSKLSLTRRNKPGARFVSIPKLNPSFEGAIEVPPLGTATSVAQGAAVVVPTDWLREVNASGIKAGDLKNLLDALEEDETGHMVSIVRKRSGIHNTLFASTGDGRHAAQIKVAIDPPDSLNERCKGASMALHDFSTVGAYMPPSLVERVKTFIELNRDVLLEYWDAKIDTETMLERLKPVPSKRSR